ncbi:MAG: MarC family protein [Pseudomonadota bacterium]
MDLTFTLHVFAALFAVMNPLANLPLLLGLTDGMDATALRATVLRTLAGISVAAALAAVAGDAILSFFGVNEDAFRAAGGVLIFLIALKMMHGEDNPSHQGSPREAARETTVDDPAIYPLTIPIQVGPGTISTLVAMANHAEGAAQSLGLAAGIALAIGSVAAVFLSAPFLSKHLTAKAESIMSRLMGMILAAIGVDMLAAGAKGLLPGLA